MNTDKIFAEAIANEYSKKDDSKVVALKKLDRKVKLPAEVFAYSNGVIMTLIFGLGMCLAMKVIGNAFILERYNSLEKYLFNPILDKYGINDTKKKYILSFYLKGVMAIISEWLKEDCADSLDFIIDIILECVKPL